MRVLMVCARYLPFTGGTETHVHEVSTRLAAMGHEVRILTADPTGKLPGREVRGSIAVERVRAYPAGRDWCFAPGLLAHVRQSDWDIVHVQGYHTFFAPLAMYAAIREHIPFVLTFHSGGHSSGFRNAIRRLQHLALRPLAGRADHLIGVSEFEADLFSRNLGVARRRFTVVPNGARLPTATTARVHGAPPLIVSLGRLEKYKGHHRVIAGFAKLLRELPEARLRILGEGPYEAELRQQVEQLGLADRVEIGAIPPHERGAMADILSSAALVTLLSDYEAHPVAVMEAVSLNVPVLTGEGSGFRELADKGMVRSIPVGSSVRRIATEMLMQIRSGPAVVPLRLPDWDDCTARVLDIYRQVLDRRGGTVSAPVLAEAAL